MAVGAPDGRLFYLFARSCLLIGSTDSGNISYITQGGSMAKYGPKAQKKIKKVMEEFKEGKLKSGTSGKKVTNRKQAVAIGISEAREEGDKVPAKK